MIAILMVTCRKYKISRWEGRVMTSQPRIHNKENDFENTFPYLSSDKTDVLPKVSPKSRRTVNFGAAILKKNDLAKNLKDRFSPTQNSDVIKFNSCLTTASE